MVMSSRGPRNISFSLSPSLLVEPRQVVFRAYTTTFCSARYARLQKLGQKSASGVVRKAAPGLSSSRESFALSNDSAPSLTSPSASEPATYRVLRTTRSPDARTNFLSLSFLLWYHSGVRLRTDLISDRAVGISWCSRLVEAWE